ncbi:MAG TPA: zinc-binding dehydrogenase [Ktedonobacterales bacterium]
MSSTMMTRASKRRCAPSESPSPAATTRQLAAAAAAVNALLAAGRLTMRIAHVYTLAEAAQAHRLV